MIYNLQKILAIATLLTSLFVVIAPNASAQKNASRKKPSRQGWPTDAQPSGAQQKPQAHEIAPSILIRWQGKPGVNRYRLQLAVDESFEDIVFDQAVEGHQHLVKGLPSGNYFWRVAAAAAETSAAYTRPERVTLSESAKGVEVPNVLMPVDLGGWRTATGEVVRLVPAQLRTGAVVDFVGLGADGRVFAIDGASGISLWTARYSQATGGALDANNLPTFTPLAVKTQTDAMSVVAATQGGVRSLNAETGRELWRASLEGHAASGVATDMDGDGSAEVVVVTKNPGMFYLLNGSSGRMIASQKLDGETIGMPYPFADANSRGVLLSYKKGRVELRKADGSIVSEVKIDGEVTTAPLIVTRGQMPFLVVGTDNGLWAMSVPELKVLGVIKAEDDAVRGTLASADVDGDGAKEIVMVTQRGRVALVSTVDGTVRWYSEGATDAASATFADVNGDGVLDVLVPGGNSFALGFSGRDGSLVMKVDEGGARAIEQKGDALRSLVVVPSLSGGGVLVGGDPARMGLRAVELPKGSVRTASK